MHAKTATGLALALILLGSVLALILQQQRSRVRASDDQTSQWKIYQHDLLNFRLSYPASWQVDDDRANEAGLSAIAEVKRQWETRASSAPPAIGFSTITFSPLNYDFAECTGQRLLDCPGFDSQHSALVTFHAFYEPVPADAIAGKPVNRHDPYSLSEDRKCSYVSKMGSSRNDIDHTLTLCVDWKEDTPKAQQDVIREQYNLLFEQIYNSFDYLRNPTM